MQRLTIAVIEVDVRSYGYWDRSVGMGKLWLSLMDEPQTETD